MAKDRYADYQGKKAWSVRHPAHRRPVRVFAPTAEAAIVAAAACWGERWQSIEFYSAVSVSPL